MNPYNSTSEREETLINTLIALACARECVAFLLVFHWC